MATEVLQLGIDSRGALQGARVFQQGARTVEEGAGKADAATRKVEGSFERLRASALNLTRVLGTLGLTIGAGALVRSVARATAEMDTMERGLKAIMGSAAGAAKELEALRQIALAPGIDLKSAVQGASQLQAVGISLETTNRVLKEFANAIALSGGGGEQLEGVIRQLQQLSAKGVVLSQDLRPIISEAPLVAKALKTAFGSVSADDIQALGLTTDQFLARLLASMEKLPRATGGAANSWDNLTSAVFQASAAYGDNFVDSVSDAMDALAGSLTTLSQNEKEMRRLADATKALGEALLVGGAVVGIVKLTKALRDLEAVTVTLQALKSPKGWLVLGVAALATYLYKQGDAAREAAAAMEEYSTKTAGLGKDALVGAHLGLVKQAATIRAQMEAMKTLLATDRAKAGDASLGFSERAAAGRRIDQETTAYANLKKLLEETDQKLGVVIDAERELGMAQTATTTSTNTAAGAAADYADQLDRLRASIVAVQNAGTPRLPNGLAIDPAAAARQGAQMDERRRLTAVLDLTPKMGGILPPPIKDVEAAQQSLSSAISDAVGGFASLGDALGALSNPITTAMRAVSDFARGMDAVQRGKAQGGTLGMLGQVAGYAGMAGAVISVASSLLGHRQSEAERERDEILKRNNDRLHELAVSLQGFTTTLRDRVTAGTAARRVGEGLEFLHAHKGLRTFTDEEYVQSILNSFGLTLDQFAKIAEDAGITIFDANHHLIIPALEQFAEASEQAARALIGFKNTATDQFNAMSAWNQIMHVNNPADQLQGTYNILEQFGGDILKQFGLANLDLTSATGRSVLDKGLQELLQQYLSGGLTDDLLNSGFQSGQEFIDTLMKASQGLDALNKSVTRATTDIPKALNLSLYQRMYGTGVIDSGSTAGAFNPSGGGITKPNGPTDTGGGVVVQGPLFGTVVNNAGDTPEVLARKMEEAARIVQSRGGFLHLPGARTS